MNNIDSLDEGKKKQEKAIKKGKEAELQARKLEVSLNEVRCENRRFLVEADGSNALPIVTVLRNKCERSCGQAETADDSALDVVQLLLLGRRKVMYGFPREHALFFTEDSFGRNWHINRGEAAALRKTKKEWEACGTAVTSLCEMMSAAMDETDSRVTKVELPRLRKCGRESADGICCCSGPDRRGLITFITYNNL